MMPRLLDGDAIDALMRPEDWLLAARQALIASARGDDTIAPRQLTPIPPIKGVLATMPGWLADQAVYGIKVVSVSERPKAYGRQPHQGFVAIFDSETGLPLGLLDATRITERRTAWISAAAVDALAPPRLETLAVLGTGAQAAAHIGAFRHVRRFARLRIWGRDFGRAKALAKRHGGEAVKDIGAALAGADLVCTTTSARKPLFEPEMVADRALICSPGASVPGYRELPAALVARAELWVDHPASVAAQADDVREAFGTDCTNRLQPLGALLTGGERGVGRPTLFRSVGVIAQDLTAAALCLARASAEGV